MSKAPAFQTYAADFYMDTNSWTIEEVGVYQRLLLTQWVNGSLPDDPVKLARIAGCSVKKLHQVWGIISKKLIPNGNGQLINKRLEEVRNIQLNYSESRRKNVMKRYEQQPTYEGTHVLDMNHSSSSSSSSSLKKELKEGETTPFELPLKDEIKEGSDILIMEQVGKICDQLYQEKIFPEVNAFKNKMLKKKKNPRAILHTLCRAYVKREFEEGPWAYCQKIIEIESAKYNARDYGKTSG